MSAGTAGSLGKSWKILLREDVPGAGGEAPAETVNHLGIPWLIMTNSVNIMKHLLNNHLIIEVLYLQFIPGIYMGDYSTVLFTRCINNLSSTARII